VDEQLVAGELAALRMTNQLLIAVGRAGILGDVADIVNQAAGLVDEAPLVDAIYLATAKAAMLGADDSDVEAEDETVIAPDRFARWGGGAGCGCGCATTAAARAPSCTGSRTAAPPAQPRSAQPPEPTSSLAHLPSYSLDRQNDANPESHLDSAGVLADAPAEGAQASVVNCVEGTAPLASEPPNPATAPGLAFVLDAAPEPCSADARSSGASRAAATEPSQKLVGADSELEPVTGSKRDPAAGAPAEVAAPSGVDGGCVNLALDSAEPLCSSTSTPHGAIARGREAGFAGFAIMGASPPVRVDSAAEPCCNESSLACSLSAVSRESSGVFFAGPAGRPGSKSFTDAVREFRSRGAVTRDVFDAMTAEERARSFTVARLLTKESVAVVQDELARAIEAGESLRKFRVNLRQRMQSSGIAIAPKWRSKGDAASLDALDASHVETVYRNSVMSAYSAGRAKHMTQPHIVAARPYWQNMTVNDGPPRQRPTHRAVHGWVMRADDPGWQVTYAPHGHNCRCRTIVRSAAWVERNGPRMHSGPLPDLPDPGWTCRPPPAVVIPPEPVPKPDTKAEPPLAPRPSRGSSLLREGDEQLDNETRAALERLDSYDKDEQGQISMRALGFIEPKPTELERIKELLGARGAALEQRFGRAIAEPMAGYEIAAGAKVDGAAAAEAARAWDTVPLPRVLRIGNSYHLLDGDAAAAAQVSSERGLSGLGALRARVVEAPINRLPKAPASRADAVRELGEAATGLRSDRASQARMRLALQDILHGEGMASRDNLETREMAERISVLRSNVVRAGHAWNGQVEIAASVLDEAQAGLTAARAGRELSAGQQRAISTLFHEEIHGTSPIARSAYEAHGAALEEAGAEILARRQARKLLGLRSAAADEALGLPTKPITSKVGGGEMAYVRAYEGPVSRLLVTVGRYDVSAADVEAALVRMRAASAARFETADAYLSGFVAELPVAEAQRPLLTRQLKQALRSTTLELGYWRGHEIRRVAADAWAYSDTGESVSSQPARACGRCGGAVTSEGHDACLGTLPGVMNACCGHGRMADAYVQLNDGRILQGQEAAKWIAGHTATSKRVLSAWSKRKRPISCQARSAVYELERNDTAGAVSVFEAALSKAEPAELQDLARMLLRLQDNPEAAAELLDYFGELAAVHQSDPAARL